MSFGFLGFRRVSSGFSGFPKVSVGLARFPQISSGYFWCPPISVSTCKKIFSVLWFLSSPKNTILSSIQNRGQNQSTFQNKNMSSSLSSLSVYMGLITASALTIWWRRRSETSATKNEYRCTLCGVHTHMS